MADRTFLRSVCRVNVDQRNASYSSLICNELSDLVETSRMAITSLRLANCGPLSYSLKIFEGYQAKGVFSLRNQHLGNPVISISISCKLCHLTRQRLKMAFNALGSYTLEPGFEIIGTTSVFLDLLAGMYLTIAIYCKIFNSKISSKNANGIIGKSFRDFNHNAKVKNAFDKDQIDLASNPVHSNLLKFPETNGNELSALEGSNRNTFQAFPGKNPLIVDNSTIKSELRFDGPVSIVSFADLGDSSDRELRRESKSLSDRIIDRLVDFNLVGTVHSKNCLCDLVTSLVKPLQCFAEHLVSFWRGIELNHQGLKYYIEHIAKGTNRSLYATTGYAISRYLDSRPDSSDEVGRPEGRGFLYPHAPEAL